MLYKVFIDDSGGKEYPKNYPYDYSNVVNPLPWSDANTSYWRDNYFVLCGIRISATNIPIIDAEISKLKKECFNTVDVEIKSTWLRSPDNRKVHYSDPFGVTDERVKKFGEDFIELICKYKNEMKIIAVVFDKRCIRRRDRYHPLLKTTQMILERIQLIGDQNVIIFDQMDPQLTITKGYGKKMLQIFVDNTGADNIYIADYSNIKDFIPQSSEKENFIQVADACAYAINKQFMKYGREWLGDNKNKEGHPVLTVERVFQKLTKNFHCHKDNKTVVGYGLSLFPNDKGSRVDWNLFN